MANETMPAAEFQALPLEFIIATPLMAAVKAQAVAAQATLDFIRGLTNPVPNDKGIDVVEPVTVNFEVEYKENDNSKKASIKVPLLSIVPIPHLRIDSLNIDFKFEVSHTFVDRKSLEAAATMEIGTGKALSLWVSASLKGSVSSKSSEETTTNRSGQLSISVHASEAPIPEGLARILTVLAKTIQVDTEPA
ncbi:MAG: DUF2589 domain-containing protein [Candidatus Poribacteria bacterium]